jgi:hypothetical protein
VESEPKPTALSNNGIGLWRPIALGALIRRHREHIVHD